MIELIIKTFEILVFIILIILIIIIPYHYIKELIDWIKKTFQKKRKEKK